MVLDVYNNVALTIMCVLRDWYSLMAQLRDLNWLCFTVSITTLGSLLSSFELELYGAKCDVFRKMRHQ